MAWVKVSQKTAKKDIVLACNRTNFPSITCSYGGAQFAGSTGENWAGCHTGGTGYCYVSLGTFSVKGYARIIVNTSCDNWGTYPPYAYLYVDGSRYRGLSLQGSNAVEIIIPKGKETINVYNRCDFTDSPGLNAWVKVQINSVEFKGK